MHAVPGRVSARPAHPLGPVQRGEALRELPSRLSAGQSGKHRVERKYKATFNVFLFNVTDLRASDTDPCTNIVMRIRIQDLFGTQCVTGFKESKMKQEIFLRMLKQN